MSLKLISAPQALAVSEQTVWDHLRLVLADQGTSPPEEAPEDRAHVRGLIEAAIGEVDGINGLLSRALITQTWQLRLHRFPRVVELPLPPLQEVLEVSYRDPAGTLQTLPETAFQVAGIGDEGKGRIEPLAGSYWPETGDYVEAVLITFRAGYGDTPEDVPATIRSAILEIVAARYAFRESITPAAQYFMLPRSAVNALENYRVWAL
ncbi:MAG: hypothetical protein RO009_17145 [Pseudorhodoplanes sp.]|nr:hypothetical protein [Pseudorhodoplanes sp.]